MTAPNVRRPTGTPAKPIWFTALLATAWLAASILATAGSAAKPVVQQRPPAHQAREEFAEAGVCSRCHVNVVLEWGISGHVTSGTACQQCHGTSDAHVANERNEIAPDRIPRGKKIATLCNSCHDAGCPETLKTASCKDCHHVHALLNPNVQGKQIQQVQDKHLKEVLQRLLDYGQAMADGQSHMQKQQWKPALQAFRRALQLRPADRSARQRIQACLRRLDPKLPGFRIASDRYDPQSGLPLEVVIEAADLHMVLVPGGEFDMGDDRYAVAQPVHTVAVEPFYLGKFEVTQSQWQAVAGKNPSRHQGERFTDAARMPVESVSWDEAAEFAASLNGTVAGAGFRLPTEAEWEFAARSTAPLECSAWFRANSPLVPDDPDRREDLDDYAPRPVGTKEPNALGIFDMQGNVTEWCSSLYRPYLFDSQQTESLPSHWPTGLRVIRGGAYHDGADGLRPTLRHAARPTQAFRWTGLRLARSVPPVPTLD